MIFSAAQSAIGDFIGSLVFAAVSVLCLSSAWQSYQTSTATLQWPSTDGTVKSSSFEYRSSKKSSYYSVTIEYRYQFNGREYENSQWGSRAGLTASTKPEAEELVKKYHPGSSIKVYLDPDDPQNSLLMPGMSPEPFILVFFGVFALVPPLLVFRRRMRTCR